MEGTLEVRLPKAVLHDHLDGGLRIDTLLELAAAANYSALPATEAEALESAMHQGESGSLEAYLASFQHTVEVMQTAAAIERVAYESGLDHHSAGVVYAEVRFGPALLTRHGLAIEDAIEAALAGLSAAEAETGVQLHLIVSALRQDTDSEQVARAAARFVGEGVVGFDLAGPEAGHPPEDHLAAIRYAQEHGLGLTLHAGEGAGVASIGSALAKCGAQRIGHGVRIIEDCVVVGNEIVELGMLAQRVRDQQVPLEVSISSNLHTGIAQRAEQHPFGLLYRAGFNVSINTDNRLMSGIDMASEFELARSAFDLSLDDLAAITRRTIEAGFGDWDRRQTLVEKVSAAYSEIATAGT